MVFTYSKIVRGMYDPSRCDYHYDTKDFDYEPSDSELLTALADILIGQTNVETNKDELKLAKCIVKQIILDADLKEELCEQYKDELHDWFEDEALDYERYGG